MSQKRILIVNSGSIQENNSTSITVNSIISYFNKECILEVYYYPLQETNRDVTGIMSVRLSKSTKILESIVRFFYKGRLRDSIKNSILDSDIRNRKSILNRCKYLILAICDFLPAHMIFNKKQIRMIDDFEPDIIYTLGSAILPLELSVYFSRRYNIPIVLHHMDNWRETKYAGSFIQRPIRRKLLKILAETENRMNYGLTISDYMAEHYIGLTKKNYISLMNTVSYAGSVPTGKKESSIFKIAYTGGLHLDRWRALINVENVIADLNANGFSIVLLIYTKQNDKDRYESLFNDKITTFCDYVPHNEISRVYESTDILIHVESFDANTVQFTKYSLSTKIPEYMSYGKPILCYAPKELAVSKYVEMNKCGIAVSDPGELRNAIEVLIKNSSLRTELSENGIRCAKEKHSEAYKNSVLSKVFDCQ